MRLPRVIRTVTFKLALVQTGLFAASAAVLFVAVYVSLTGYARTQLRASIETELGTLAEARATDGSSDLIATIGVRMRDRGPKGFSYLLKANDGRSLAGSLPPNGLRLGWQDLAGAGATARRDDEPHRLEALGETLPTGEFLVVARDLREIDDVKEQLIQSFGIAAALTLGLAIASGVLTSLGALRRVEAMNLITRSIMEGDLGRRVPTRGTGDEFDRLAANTNEMLDRIQLLMEGLRQVSNDIAHDLRTPLTHLRQRLEAARQGPRSVEAYEAVIEATTDETDTILKMFAALLRIAQIEAGTRRSGFGDIDLSEIASTILDIYGPVAEDHGQTLVGTIASDICVRGDRELLLQMLANLVENAIRHAGQGARIVLSLAADGRGPLVSVSDDGPGIAPDLQGKVFRRFFRVDPTRAEEGHGLGLSLVQAVADLHAIRVSLHENAPGLKVDLHFAEAERSQTEVFFD